MVDLKDKIFSSLVNLMASLPFTWFRFSSSAYLQHFYGNIWGKRNNENKKDIDAATADTVFIEIRLWNSQ